jgi:hypothetical protein
MRNYLQTVMVISNKNNSESMLSDGNFDYEMFPEHSSTCQSLNQTRI